MIAKPSRHIGSITLAAALGFLAGCAGSSASQPDEPSPKEASAEETAAEPTTPDIPDSELVLWLRPEASQFETTGDKVTNWKDASGYGNDMIAPGNTFRPTLDADAFGGRGAVRFDGQDDMLLRDGFSPERLPMATVFIVAAPAANTGQFDGLLSAGNRNAEDSFTGFHVDLGGGAWTGCDEKYPDSTTALNTINVQSAKTTVTCGQDFLEDSVPFARPALISVTIDDTQTAVRLDGKEQKVAGGGPDLLTVPQVRLGARFHRQKYQGYYDGAISEVLVYGQSLSEADIAKVEAYLGDKYGIAISQ
ncbi:LamG domain-containing protein [Persicimonas caeni]|uniref:LamG domain-containing protein n=1 Tax=Persicimonas caeni TaxID=2292766 RepID=A0A4Y6Q0F7_PERCE|nr:LamG domain-containing protein [Persicimonas caeni]QDG53475.1 LamG domain-containing protein [Persicimonas caeni]QED34696.1 LamG domain-containing protein [Persicimonas caeni]